MPMMSNAKNYLDYYSSSLWYVMQTFSGRAGAGGDDGIVRAGVFSNNASVIYFGKDSSAAISNFLRIPSVTIPQGAVIVSATLTYKASAARSGATVNVNIKGNDADDAAAPTTAAEFAALVRTTASVNWQPTGWSNDTLYVSPDLTTIVQEIVDRAGWASGNDMQFIMDDNGSSTNAYREFDSYDGDAAAAVLLTVTYI